MLANYEFKKRVTMPSGKDVDRVAKLTIDLPETEEATVEALGANLWLYAIHGLIFAAKTAAQAKLTGGGTLETRALMRDFNTGVRTLIDVMHQSPDEASERLLAQERFAPIRDVVATLKSGDTVKLVWSPADVPAPQWFDKGLAAFTDED